MLWKRKIALSVGGKVITNPLRIEIDVTFSEVPETDIGKVTVYNLQDSTINAISAAKTMRISAGYESDYGNIFNGEVIKATTSWSGNDKITEFELADSNKKYREERVTKSFAPGTTSDEVLMYLIAKAGLGVAEFAPVKTITYRNGVTVTGKVQDSIKKTIAETDSKYYVKANMAYVRNPKKGDMQGFVLNENTGLVDTPERFEKTEGDKEVVGYKIKSLINHQITTDSIIFAESRAVSGMFRVSEGTHSGNNIDGQLLTEMEVYPI